MVSVSKTDAFLSTWSAAALSKDGDLVALVEDSVAVDIPKLCQLGQWALQEDSLHQLDPEVLVVGFVAVSEELHAAVVSEVASEVVIDLTSVEDEAASDTKAEVALVEEVGMVVARLMALVTVRRHPLMPLLDPAEEEASVVGTVALQSMAA